ncbi:hypothetical protein [Actinoplanes sp. NPDC049316]|uniref:hypothetical protein n=1 Tax=Actinoplanes sp. NPDC049316 TaxID=3154727 RepID=UPI00341A68C6
MPIILLEGLLWCDSGDAIPAGEATRRLPQHVMPEIAHAVDLRPGIGAPAGLVADGPAAAAVTRTGEGEPLPGPAGPAGPLAAVRPLHQGPHLPAEVTIAAAGGARA